MSYKIDDIEGIGSAYAAKLIKAGIENTEDLLQKCGTPSGREAAAKATGVGESTILNWTNMADLMRIAGVGPQFSELLKASGVDTVKELRNRNAQHLAEVMYLVNNEQNLASTSPASNTIVKWVAAAKDMEPRIID